MLPAGLLCSCGWDVQWKVWLQQQVALTDTILSVLDFSISHKEPHILQLINSWSSMLSNNKFSLIF